ncbi:hypothetical protein [Bacillus thermotolerans]|nr:hypothetical protein [Bacillus thermotolerans]KKB33864.1 Aldehyde dehydrogenase [Bacillus thermotolerans]
MIKSIQRNQDKASYIPERGLQVAQQIESGMAYVNDQPVNVEAGIPFGGEWAFNEFTTVQWVTVQEKPRQFPFE